MTQVLEREDLMTAIGKKDFAAASRLVEQGANLDMSSEAGWTPLMLAILQDSLEVTEQLLKNGADPNLTTHSADNSCRSPLAVAISNGRLAAVKLLVAYHADTEAPSCQGVTALKLAEKLARRPFQQKAVADIVFFLSKARA